MDPVTYLYKLSGLVMFVLSFRTKWANVLFDA